MLSTTKLATEVSKKPAHEEGSFLPSLLQLGTSANLRQKGHSDHFAV